ncbi:hypothetical protein LZ32DRAFT_678817 [Colletotrichum eremochloae]|nr:hypothetical protein LZ32DRAFT_678817 [Colletotrichum eremochloae]
MKIAIVSATGETGTSIVNGLLAPTATKIFQNRKTAALLEASTVLNPCWSSLGRMEQPSFDRACSKSLGFGKARRQYCRNRLQRRRERETRLSSRPLS